MGSEMCIRDSFNPVHKGHILCPKSLVKRNIIDKVIFVPSYVPPLKDSVEDISPAMRLEMVKIAVQPYPFFLVSDIEIKRGGISYTIDTVKELKEQYSSAKLFLILGSDWISRFHEWKDYEMLSEIIDFIIMRREGEKESVNNTFISEKVRKKFQDKIVSVPVVPVSSSIIRKRVRDEAFLEEYLPRQVVLFIKENRLYQ